VEDSPEQTLLDLLALRLVVARRLALRLDRGVALDAQVRLTALAEAAREPVFELRGGKLQEQSETSAARDQTACSWQTLRCCLEFKFLLE